MNTKEEFRAQYFKELSLRLRAEGIQSEPSNVRTLRVYQDGHPVCDVAYSGDVYRDVKYPDIYPDRYRSPCRHVQPAAGGCVQG